MNYLLFILFGLAPSFLWLLYYLRKDAHPEPKRMISKVFFFGMMSAIPALALEFGFQFFFDRLPLASFTSSVLFIFIGISLTEEVCKFMAVRLSAFSNSALDEPVDIMLYMVISALGFAAIENTMVLFGLNPDSPAFSIATLSGIRFLGATFLHTLASALLGYFLALSYSAAKNRRINIAKAFLFATLLHGFFDLYILKAEGTIKFFAPLAIFIATAFFISFAFGKLRAMKSACQIQ
ncbi:MAG: PrsW family intramembrane metalloprotease [Candidatus Wildermuthbacteria bacterium]|nr:PrsW family intramembrane metalloprotease [Candidatus Wildermuthbacteria bacterium]